MTHDERKQLARETAERLQGAYLGKGISIVVYRSKYIVLHRLTEAEHEKMVLDTQRGLGGPNAEYLADKWFRGASFELDENIILTALEQVSREERKEAEALATALERIAVSMEAL